ncbi:MAG: lysophospholipid acyltransferase family protein [Bacteroidales bacterium]|nr:lysophospholipid acyltransferase family protein [Bacteroidales bacterium]
MNKALTFILFNCLLVPLSRLPMRVLYCISDFVAFVLYDVVKYRKQVVFQNLQNSFPNLNSKQINDISKKYYAHLADLLVEAVKMLTISKQRLTERYKCLNKEILEPYFEKNQSVILMSAHYNDWEYMVLSLDLQFSHHGIGVGKAMSNKAFEHLMHLKRTRYGTEVVYADSIREVFQKYEDIKTPCAYMMLFDQSPNNVKKSYITTFLSQKTAVIYGPEYFAKKYNFPVFFYAVRKVKRGYYEFDLKLLCEDSQSSKYGEITDNALSALSSLINEHPQYWLWSHKRWKHKL